jgi:hypothetical protein
MQTLATIHRRKGIPAILINTCNMIIFPYIYSGTKPQWSSQDTHHSQVSQDIPTVKGDISVILSEGQVGSPVNHYINTAMGQRGCGSSRFESFQQEC